MSVSVFDFGELFTLSVRPVVGAAVKRGLSFYFDYPGAPTCVHGDAQGFQRSIYRVVSAASRTLRRGALIVAGDVVEGPVDGSIDLRIHAAVSGERKSNASIDELLAELHLAKVQESPDGNQVVSARGTCPVVGADLRYRCVPSAGILLDFSLRHPGVLRNDLRLPNARGSRALVLHNARIPVQGLNRRLLRLGWQVSLFDTEAAFQEAWAQDDGSCRLVIVIESGQLNLAELARISATLPDAEDATSCMYVYAVAAGSAAAGAQVPPGWVLHTMPFLPSELWDFTRRADPDGDDVHEHSRPTPLPASHRPRVLVVDDDEVNRVIASGLLQMIGYEALSAGSGDEAIAICQQVAPDAVLMDINMPGRDGYETTAALKRLQQLGGIPPFPIIAATAAGTLARSIERGLDGHLTKPLLAEELRTQLNRALQGLATGL